MKTLFSKHPRVYKSRLIGLGPGPIVQTRRCIFLRGPRHERGKHFGEGLGEQGFSGIIGENGAFLGSGKTGV